MREPKLANTTAFDFFGYWGYFMASGSCVAFKHLEVV